QLVMPGEWAPPRASKPPAHGGPATLAAAPVSPDTALASLIAPVMATLLAVPAARALPVSPVFPESPEVIRASVAFWAAAAPLLRRPAFSLTLPVFPVAPESPDWATPLAAEVASPVPPELPELPDAALSDGSATPLM